MDTYTSIDMKRALLVGYKVVRYFEIWHYPGGGKKFFKDFILNIVKRKVECSGFPLSCITKDQHEDYVKQLREQSGIKTTIDVMHQDAVGRYLNKIMANSIWGKWMQNPSSQQELITCLTIHEYHECLFSGQVKRVSIVSDKLLQVEMK